MEIPRLIPQKMTNSDIKKLADKVNCRRKNFTIEDLKVVIGMLDEIDAKILTRAVRCNNEELFYGVFDVLVDRYLQREVK